VRVSLFELHPRRISFVWLKVEHTESCWPKLFYAFHFLIKLHLSYNSTCIFVCLYAHLYLIFEIFPTWSPTKFHTLLLGFPPLRATLCCWDFSYSESYHIHSFVETSPSWRSHSIVGIFLTQIPIKFHTHCWDFLHSKGKNSQVPLTGLPLLGKPTKPSTWQVKYHGVKDMHSEET